VAQDFHRSLAQLRDALGIDRQRGGTRKYVIQRDPAVDFAAADVPGEEITQHAVEGAQFVRKPDLDVEVAMVHRSQFDRQGAAWKLGCGRGETGHARDHGRCRRHTAIACLERQKGE
jgi:hypothetical protein